MGGICLSRTRFTYCDALRVQPCCHTAGCRPVCGRMPSHRVAVCMGIHQPYFFDPFIHKRTLRLSSRVSVVNDTVDTGPNSISEIAFSFSLDNFSEVECLGSSVCLLVCFFAFGKLLTALQRPRWSAFPPAGSFLHVLSSTGPFLSPW